MARLQKFAVVVVVPASLIAASAHRLDSQAAVIAPDARVRLASRQWSNWRFGQFVSMDSQRLLLRVPGPSGGAPGTLIESVPISIVQRLEVSHKGSGIKGAVLGGITGTVLGGVVGGVLMYSATNDNCIEECGIGVILGVPVGAAVGLVVGALVGPTFGHRWRPVPISNRPVSLRRSTAAVTSA